MPKLRTIAVATTGGDAPGMNAAIRAVTRSALGAGREVAGVRRGFAGLLEGDFVPLEAKSVSGIINRGGTILRTVRCEAFKRRAIRRRAAKQLSAVADALVVIGGNGSFRGAHALAQEAGIRVACIPATIDNDVYGSDTSIGFDTAANTALEAIDNIRDTAFSHERVFVIEVMGRKRGFLALEVAVAGGAACVLIPEVPVSKRKIVQTLLESHRRGKTSSIVVVAEGAGEAGEVGDWIRKGTGLETRVTVLGHLQRGGRPTATSRLLASVMGHAAVQALLRGEDGFMVGVEGQRLVRRPLQTVLGKRKPIDTSLLALLDKLNI